MSMEGHWTPAWHEDCARVGLAEPSTDLAQIKRAYAKTLRVTRPDDDAQAYQALRESYDRLVAFARRQTEVAASRPQEASTSAGDEPDPPPAGAGPDANAMASADAMAAAIALDAELALAERLPLSTDPVPISESEYPRPRPAAPPPPSRPPVHREVRPDARADTSADADARGGSRNEPPPDLPPVPTPAALCDEVATLIRRWPARVVHELPRLRAALGELPLAAQLEASARFADLVIRQSDQVPGPLLDLLRDHFDWSRDFRIERLLGPDRMAALAEVLERRPEPVNDPVVLAEFSPSVRVVHLAGSRIGTDRMQAWFAALLMGHALPLHLQWAGWQLLRRLGLDEPELGAVNQLIGRVRGFSVVIIGLLVAALDFALRGHAANAIDLGIVTTFGMVIFCTGMGYACRLLDFLRESTPAWWARQLAHPRWQRASPWVGAASLAVVGAALQWAPSVGDWLALLAIPALLIGLLLGLKGPLHLVATAVSLCIFLILSIPGVTPVTAGLLAAWVSAGTSVYRLRLYVPNPDFRVQPRPPKGGAKAVIALLTVGLPTLMAWLSNIAGMRVTLGALTIAFAGTSRYLPAIEPSPLVQTLILFGCFYLALAVQLAMQRAGWRLGRRLFRGPTPAARDTA